MQKIQNTKGVTKFLILCTIRTDMQSMFHKYKRLKWLTVISNKLNSFSLDDGLCSSVITWLSVKIKKNEMSVTTSIHRKNTTNITASVRFHSIHTYSISATSERTKRLVCPRALFFKRSRNIAGSTKGK